MQGRHTCVANHITQLCTTGGGREGPFGEACWALRETSCGRQAHFLQCTVMLKEFCWVAVQSSVLIATKASTLLIESAPCKLLGQTHRLQQCAQRAADYASGQCCSNRPHDYHLMLNLTPHIVASHVAAVSQRNPMSQYKHMYDHCQCDCCSPCIARVAELHVLQEIV